MFNKVILIGNLTKDPELRYTASGTPVCTFRLATTTKFKSGDDAKEETLFINVVVWGKQGESVAQHLVKGRSVLVDGRLQEQKWEADGQQRSRMEIVAQSIRFLGSRRDDGEQSGQKYDKTPPEETTDLEPF